ncbi:MAG: PAS domain S-box protein [Candidatus Aureabacteria bacterium]|nr:PAS domain S-box protein [Candidatus Auribacterota bacterium]
MPLSPILARDLLHPIFAICGLHALMPSLFPLLAMTVSRRGQSRRAPRRRPAAPKKPDLHKVLDSLDCFVVIEDSNYTICYMNKRLRRKFGDKTGKKCYRVFIGRKTPCPLCPVRTILHEGKKSLTYLAKDKRGRIYESTAVPHVQPDGNKVIIEVLSDVTEKIRAENTIRELTKTLKERIQKKTDELTQSQKLYNALLTNATDAIFSIDPGSNSILRSNHAAEILTGYTTKELLSMKNTALYTPGTFDDICKALRDSPTGSGAFSRVEIIKKDGGRAIADVSANILSFGGRRIILAICRDIRQRLMFENRMRQIASVLEGMSASVILTDTQSVITYVNPAAVKMLGYREEEMLGRPARQFFEGIPGNPPDIAAIIRRESKNGYWESEIFNRRKSGEVFPIYLRQSMIRNERGELIGYAGISEDISVRKRMEEELIQKEKLSALGELVASIAHELNNPLTGVLGYAEIMQQYECPKGLKQDLHRLYKEAIRCQCLVKNLLTFARKTLPHKDFSDINELIKSSVELKAYQFKADQIEFIINLGANLPTVLIDPHQMQQVLLNILNNAHFALLEKRRSRRITITSAAKGGRVYVRIGNNGPHIPEERIEKIFDPFYSTKEFGKGTGLGLSIAQGIVKDHGGEIVVASEEGKETVFTVEIPIDAAPPLR